MCFKYRRKKKNICWFCVLTLWAWECIYGNEYMLIMWVNVCWLTGPTSLIEVNGLAATYDLWWYVCNRKWEIYFETYLGVMFFAFLLFVAIVNPFFWWPTRSNWGENIPQYRHHQHRIIDITIAIAINHCWLDDQPVLTEVRESPKSRALFLGQNYKKSLLTIRNIKSSCYKFNWPLCERYC